MCEFRRVHSTEDEDAAAREGDARLFAAADVMASIVAGLVSAFLGVAIGQAIWSSMTRDVRRVWIPASGSPRWLAATVRSDIPRERP